MSADGKSAKNPSRAEQLKARPKQREKFTAEEFEQRFDGWVMERRERVAARTPEQNAQLRRHLLIGAMAVVIAVLVVLFATNDNGHESASAAKADRISTLESDLTEVERPRDDEAAKAALGDFSTEVSTKADEVAEAQQGFAALEHAADTAPSPNDGTPSEEMVTAVEHRRSLAGFFEPDSLLLEDELVYQWTTGEVTEAGQIDPRFAWFVRHDGATVSEATASTWRVESALPVDGSTEKARAVWICIDTETEEVLAIATADYSAETGQFSSLEVGVTVLGGEYAGEVSAGVDGGTAAGLDGEGS